MAPSASKTQSSQPPADLNVARQIKVVTQTAFGIAFSSARTFTELATAPDQASPDSTVSIEWGNAPFALENATRRQPWWQTAAGEYLLQVPGVARFYVTPRMITVCPNPEADDTAVRLYLFGSVMGALLHLRGVLPLHGSAVCLAQNAGAAVFTGVSSAGKSTLAAALARRGYPLMADDISAVSESADRQLLHPGLARSKLWRKSSDFLRLDPADGHPVRPDKWAFAMFVAPQPMAVTHVYELMLKDGGDMTIANVEGVDKLRLLDRQTYRRNYLGGFSQSGPHLQRLAKLAGQVRVSQITRPRSDELSVDAVVDLVERDWAR